MDCRTLALHEYELWKEWSQGGKRRRSRQNLMDDKVDPVAERHMYIPANFAGAAVTRYADTNLGTDEMVERVVAFFQTVQSNHVLRQLERAEGHYEHRQHHPCLQDDSLTSTTATVDDTCLTELGFTPSFIRGQEVMWNYARMPPPPPSFQLVLPDWLHEEARKQGQRIRVVEVHESNETKSITCIGCQKRMIATANVQIVFCPNCGCTFSPEAMA